VNWVLTALFAGLCLWLLLAAMTRRGKLYEFPFLAAAMTFAFILPQLPGLASDPFLPAGLYAKTVCFAILCLAMCRLGWMPDRRPITQTFQWQVSEARLLLASAAMSIAGAYFYYKLSRIPVEFAVATTFSGENVLLSFFSQLLPYGLAIALLCFFNRPTVFSAIIIAVDIIFYLDRIFVTGKRAETTALVMVFALAIWFRRRRAMPYFLVLAGVLVGTLAMSSTGEYRQMNVKHDGPQLSSIEKISVLENFENLLSSGGPEMRNAMYRIHMVDRNQSFDYGAFHWDTLVWNYVPAQFVGKELKDSFMIDIDDQFTREYYFDKIPGTTETGLADAYASFWYFGAFKFFIISYFMSRLYGAAMAGNTEAQLFYMLLAVPAMHAISHYTQWVLSEWIHIAAFVMPGLLFARIRKRPAQSFAAAAIGRAS